MGVEKTLHILGMKPECVVIGGRVMFPKRTSWKPKLKEMCLNSLTVGGDITSDAGDITNYFNYHVCINGSFWSGELGQRMPKICVLAHGQRVSKMELTWSWTLWMDKHWCQDHRPNTFLFPAIAVYSYTVKDQVSAYLGRARFGPTDSGKQQGRVMVKNEAIKINLCLWGK